jgi:hypothetical protein
MSGVAVIRHLLATNSTLVAQVPAAKIMAGVIPLNSVLPAVSVTEVDTVDRTTLGMNTTKVLLTERVQVTVMTKSYTLQKTLLDLVRKACPNSRGTINGVEVESIVPDGSGPDLSETELGIYMQSRDFIVRFQVSA